MGFQDISQSLPCFKVTIWGEENDFETSFYNRWDEYKVKGLHRGVQREESSLIRPETGQGRLCGEHVICIRSL